MAGSSSIAATPGEAVSARASSNRFTTLDALRGMGALSVVAGHCGIDLHGYGPPFSHLSVDMFFMLSGFVLAHAYDRRFVRGLSTMGFMQARARRLYPIFAIGLVIGLVAEVVTRTHGLSPGQTLIAFGLGIFGLPAPPMGSVAALYPLDGPFWSLFFEFWVANLLYGLFWRQLKGRVLWAAIAVSAACVVVSIHVYHRIDTGWTWRTFSGGLSRVLAAYLIGVALSRLHEARPMKLRLPSWVCLASFLLAVLAPIHGRASHVYEAFVVFAFFPALLLLSAVAVEPRAGAAKALGDMSYALYAIHRPILALLVGGLSALSLAPLGHRSAIGVEVVFLLASAVLAWGVNKAVSADWSPRRWWPVFGARNGLPSAAERWAAGRSSPDADKALSKRRG